jgi:hypothetical protein
MILVILFIVGTVTKNVFSLIYLVFALFYLYGGQFVFQKRDNLWRWVRYYNFLVIVAQVRSFLINFDHCLKAKTKTILQEIKQFNFVQIVFQAPFISSNANPESVQQILGLSKVEETLFSFMILHFIIFILLSFQSWVCICFFVCSFCFST